MKKYYPEINAYVTDLKKLEKMETTLRMRAE